MRTILHFLSVVQWENLQADSNFEVFLKTVRWLPDWHHYVLVPWRTFSAVTDLMPDVPYSLLSYEYPSDILAARHEFRSAEFARIVNLRKMDIDFLFCHQPELIGNLLAAFSSKRARPISFVFFHWIDCPASRGSADNISVRFRQQEAVSLAERFFVHGPQVVKEYFADADKAAYMSLSAVDLRTVEPVDPGGLPEIPYLVFNHRRTSTTGWKKLEAWVPDGFAIVYTGHYSREEYRWVLEHAHCAVCMISGYCTWNMAVQDPVMLGVPLVCYAHPTLQTMLGDYPTWIKTRKQFQSAVGRLGSVTRVPAPLLVHFDADFQNNLTMALKESDYRVETRRRNGSKHTDAWKAEIHKQSGISKATLIRRIHGKTASAHASWQYIRRDLLRDGYRSSVIRDETIWYQE